MTPSCIAPVTFSTTVESDKNIAPPSHPPSIPARNHREKLCSLHRDTFTSPIVTQTGVRIFYGTCCYEWRISDVLLFFFFFFFSFSFNQTQRRRVVTERKFAQTLAFKLVSIIKHLSTTFFNPIPGLVHKSKELSLLAAELIFCLG